LNDTSTKIRLLLVEDHPILRVGLHNVLSKSSSILVVGEAQTGKEARKAAAELKPDMVLMDLRLPDGSGVDVCRDILKNLPNIRILFLTSFKDDDALVCAVNAGAAGYLLKGVEPDQLIQAIELVAKGHSILYRSIKPMMANSIQGQIQKLPSQQQRIMALVAKGKTNKEIAVDLKLSDKTIRNHLTKIFGNFGITRRTQVATLFAKLPSE